MLHWVVEFRSCYVSSCTEIAHVHCLLVTLDDATIHWSVASIEASIICSWNWASTVGKLSSSILLMWLLECVCMAISCWLATSTYGCIVSTVAIISSIWSSKRSNIHCSIQVYYIVSNLIVRYSLNWSLSIVLTKIYRSNIKISIFTAFIWILVRNGSTIEWEILINLLVNWWITLASSLSLLSQLCLGNCLWNWSFRGWISHVACLSTV